MRVLILNYEYPPLGGGAGIVTRHIAERLADTGHIVHVVTTWFPGESEVSVEGNLSIIRLHSARKKTYKSNPLEMLSWIKYAMRYFRQMNNEPSFDICLANFTIPGGWVARYLWRKWELPYVILSHGHDIPWFAPKQMFFWHLLCFKIIKNILLESKYNVLLTQELKNMADTFIGAKLSYKNKVIPNGLLVEHCRTGFDTPDKPMHILFVGRMVEQKDPLSFLKACKSLNDMNLNLHFTMIGDGPLKEDIEKMTLKWGIKNIDILGKVSHYKVLEVYESAHVLVLPSREEAMSMVLLEAVSRGLYTITTPSGGSKQIITPGVNGEIIEYDNVSQIVEAVNKFYYTKYLTGYQYPEYIVNELYSKYNWNTVVEKYLELFKAITQKPSISSSES
jgi:glycosyltransferase involved in cell wall biosynthesis